MGGIDHQDMAGLCWLMYLYKLYKHQTQDYLINSVIIVHHQTFMIRTKDVLTKHLR